MSWQETKEVSTINTEKLRGIIAEKGLTGTKIAPMLNMSAKTFYSKMKTGNFTLGDAEKLADILDISDRGEIFLPAKCLDKKHESSA